MIKVLVFCGLFPNHASLAKGNHYVFIFSHSLYLWCLEMHIQENKKNALCVVFKITGFILYILLYSFVFSLNDISWTIAMLCKEHRVIFTTG